jgi:hypothetical protein
MKPKLWTMSTAVLERVRACVASLVRSCSIGSQRQLPANGRPVLPPTDAPLAVMNE